MGRPKAALPSSRKSKGAHMFSRFFIDRPIFAAVLSIFIVIAGLAAMRNLPIAQYPEIAPPVVTITANYPGASAGVIEQTVAAPLENQINGVEHMIYMSSTSTSNGQVQIHVTFDIGTDIDQATVNINNRVRQVEPRLPAAVRRLAATRRDDEELFSTVTPSRRTSAGSRGSGSPGKKGPRRSPLGPGASRPT